MNGMGELHAIYYLQIRFYYKLFNRNNNMKKAIKICGMLLLGVLTFALTGCSGDDDKDEMEYYYDWREGPKEFYIIKCLHEEGTGADARMTAVVMADPNFSSEQWEAYGYPPIVGFETRLNFSSSELAGEYAEAAYCPVLVKKFREAVQKGLVVDRHYSCVVEPYYGADAVLNGAKGMITDQYLNGLRLVRFEQDGKEYLAWALNLDGALYAKAGQQVTLSGRVITHCPLVTPEEMEYSFEIKTYIWLTSITISE